MAGDLDDEDDDPMQDIESVTSTNTWDSVKYDVDMTLGRKSFLSSKKSKYQLTFSLSPQRS